MNMHTPPRSNGRGKGDGSRKPNRTPKGRQIDPQALDEVRALLTDRPRRRDLLIEHLHLIQDHYGYLSAAHLTALAAEMKLALTEVYEVATFYSHFDVVKDGPAAAGRHRARVRFAVLRHGRRGSVAEEIAGDPRQGRARGARALHGRLRPRAGRCRRAFADLQGDVRSGRRRREDEQARACLEAHGGFCRLRTSRRLRAAEGLSVGQAHARRTDQDRQRRRPARPRRRRISHRPQVVVGARRARAPHVRGQRRRGRARHLQGPLLSRARPAPLHRRHADRGLGGRGAGDLSVYPRRISRAAADAGRRNGQGRGGGSFSRTPSCICGAAPALTSAAKSWR